MWKGRFTENTAQAVQKFTQSLDLDWALASYDIEGSVAHARMLGSEGLIPPEEARRIEDGLNRIREEIASGTLVPTQELEDVHMNIESRLIELLGPTGARLHTGRSRNDQVAVTMRLFLRDRLRHIASGMEALLSVLLERAARHMDVIVPGFTHLQQAQPISMGHYWMAHFAAFSRDCERLLFALGSLRECPLGAGALAGSTLPLNREMTAKALGFASPTRNSLDTVAQRDMADYHSFAVTFATHCSRLAEDFVIYSSREFGWLLLPDAFCTGSSMMPQKKNPDVLELLRGKTGQILGHFLDLLCDAQGPSPDLRPGPAGGQAGTPGFLRTVEEMLAVLVPLLSAVEVDGEKAAEGMNDGFLLATDVAEYRRKGRSVPAGPRNGGRPGERVPRTEKGLFDLTGEEWKELLPEAGEDLFPLSLRSAVERRRTYGGHGLRPGGETDRRRKGFSGELQGIFQTS